MTNLLTEDFLEAFIETLAHEHRQFGRFIYHLFKHLEQKMSNDFSQLQAQIATLEAQQADANAKIVQLGTDTAAEIQAIIAVLQGETGNGNDQAVIDAMVLRLANVAQQQLVVTQGVANASAQLEAETAQLTPPPPPSPAPAPSEPPPSA